MLRISGAIQVLSEVLKTDEPEEPGIEATKQKEN